MNEHPQSDPDSSQGSDGYGTDTDSPVPRSNQIPPDPYGHNSGENPVPANPYGTHPSQNQVPPEPYNPQPGMNPMPPNSYGSTPGANPTSANPYRGINLSRENSLG